jgi:hypothetical protein
MTDTKTTALKTWNAMTIDERTAVLKAGVLVREAPTMTDCATPAAKPIPATTTLFTDAPEAYDGFGTVTLEIVGKTTRPRAGLPVRKVRVEIDHRDWQLNRYDSGSCAHTGWTASLDMFIETGYWTLDDAPTIPEKMRPVRIVVEHAPPTSGGHGYYATIFIRDFDGTFLQVSDDETSHGYYDRADAIEQAREWLTENGYEGEVRLEGHGTQGRRQADQVPSL